MHRDATSNDLARLHQADLQPPSADAPDGSPAPRSCATRSRSARRCRRSPRLAVGPAGRAGCGRSPMSGPAPDRDRTRTQRTRRRSAPDPAGADRMIDTMTGRLVSPTLIGRERELAAVAGTLDRIADRRRRRPTCSSPARPASASPASCRAGRPIASARGMRVLTGGCANIGEGGLPFGPIVDALRGLVRDLDPATIETVVDGARADLARLVPALGPTVARRLEPTARPSRPGCSRRSLATLGRLAAIEPRRPRRRGPALGRPVDARPRRLSRAPDPDRADRARLDLPRRRAPSAAPAAAVARRAGADRPASSAWSCPACDLARTRELVATIRGSTPTTDEVARIHERSDGNPFFVEELLMAGSEDGSGRLPPTLRGVLLARIARPARVGPGGRRRRRGRRSDGGPRAPRRGRRARRDEPPGRPPHRRREPGPGDR